MMRVKAGGTLWIVPPARAVWVPAESEHEIHGLGDFAMRTLYLPVEMSATLPRECCALDVTPLLRELVLELVERCPIDEADEPAMRIAGLAIERIAEAPVLRLQLPLPRDPRALRLAERLQAEPALPGELPELAREAGASARTPCPRRRSGCGRRRRGTVRRIVFREAERDRAGGGSREPDSRVRRNRCSGADSGADDG